MACYYTLYICIVHTLYFLHFRNLGNNVFPALPTLGLSGLLHLKTFNNPALREFPAPERFPRVQTMVLSYAYHCCSFLSVEVEDPVTKSSVQESILFPTDNDFDMILWNSSFTDIWPQLSKYLDRLIPRLRSLELSWSGSFKLILFDISFCSIFIIILSRNPFIFLSTFQSFFKIFNRKIINTNLYK